MKKISNKGFTLIELLATILIIGLVLGITTYGIIISVNKAKEKSTILSLASIKEAARTYSGELGEDSWKNGDKNTYFCVTIEELINKGLLNKNAKSVEKGGKLVDYVVVIKNKTTKVIEKEEILTDESDSDAEAYKICTGNIKNENITSGTQIGDPTSYTDTVYINFTDAVFESEDIVIIEKYCKYSDSSTNLDSGAKEGTITDDNKCILEGLTQGTEYWVRVCEEKGRSVSCDTKSVTTKKIVAPTIAVDTNKNNIVKITYDDSNIKEEAFYYFKSTIGGISSENVSTCRLNDNKYTCEEDSVNNITGGTWYRTTSEEISITYSTPGDIKVTAETRDKSDNSNSSTKEFSLYKITFNKGTADTIGGKTNNIELMCLVNKGESCSITSPSIEKSGYQVIGWNTNSSATTSSWNVNTLKSINSTEIYYPILKQATYTITYNANGGTGAPSADTKKYNQPIALSNIKPTMKNYTFVNWNTKADGTGTSYNSGSSYIDNKNITLYAIWRKNVVTINFKINDGIVANNDENFSKDNDNYILKNGIRYSQTIDYNKSMADSGIKYGLTDCDNEGYLNISRTGYIAVSGAEWICLSGNCKRSTYNQDTNTYTASSFCDASNGDCTVTLGVNWEQVINDYRCSTSDNNNYYLITTCNDTTCKYTRNNCNSNTSGTISRDTIMQCKETTIKGDRCDSSLKNMYSITTCTAADCKYTSKNGNTTISGTIDRCNLRSCPIATFYSNGGTFSNGTLSYEFNIRVGSNYSFKDIPEVTRENYTFVNWNTKADGTGTSYNSDSNFTGNENITLYAIWQVNSTTSTINANRYICSSYNGTNRLSIFYITTKTIVNNNQSCAYTKLNGLGSASDFSKNLYSTNPSWSIDCYDLEETLSSKCKAPAYYIKANGGLNCRSGASLDTSYRGDWALSNCTKLDSIYLTTSKMNNGTDNWYYDSNTGCYLRGNYLSSSNPCSSSGGSSSNDWCHCSDDIDCAGMTEYNNFCNGGVCYYKKPEWTTASAGCK